MGTHRRLGGYRLLEEMGRGATSVVHLAMDSEGREVAVKELLPRLEADLAARRRLARDVAPKNVIVLGDRPTLIDFGIAHEAGAGEVTRPGLVAGTPAYLAPELIEGDQATAASDVFSWAATVAYAATGRSPFGMGSLHGVCFRILRGEADLGGIAEPLASLLPLGLRRDPSRRPTARWFAGALAGVMAA